MNTRQLGTTVDIAVLRRGRRGLAALVYFAFLIGLCGAPTVALADTFVVNTTVDSVDLVPGDGACSSGEGECSLRAAIQEANAWAGADEIVLPAGTYVLAIGETQEDASATGDLDIVATDPLTVTGGGESTTIIDADGIDRVMDVQMGAGPVYLSDLTLRNGLTYEEAGNGGGLRVGRDATVKAVRVTITDNQSFNGAGGGIAIESNARLELIESNVLANSAYSYGGVINSGTALFIDSTLEENARGELPGAVRNVGAMTLNRSTYAYNFGEIESSGTLTVENSTFSSNTGAAIRLVEAATTTISHTTIALNGGAGIVFEQTERPYFAQVLLSGNSPNCINNGSGLFPFGQFNLSDDESCTIFGTNLIGSIWNALLGPLQDNGGNTETHALLVGSDAIDRGPLDFVGPPFTDQRGDGYPRVVGNAIDIGAFEYAPVAPVQTGPVYTVNATGDEDGPCLVAQCTLRQAIHAANTSPNVETRETIQFQISGGIFTIQLASPLPTITEAVLLNGEIVPDDRIVLDGSLAGADAAGFTLDSSNSTIVGFEITNFGGAGIAVLGGQGNTFEGNSIYNNGGLGIDLGNDGVTANDMSDGDTGPNDRQNAPVLRGATAVDMQTRVQGFLSSKPGTSYTLQFFANNTCDNSFYGEGETPVGGAYGTYVVNTDANGYAAFDFDLGMLNLLENSAFTALATDQATNNTSEFSRCVILGPNNDAWPRALRLNLTGSTTEPMATATQFIDKPGQARWYKFSVSPGSTVQVKLTNLPANYDIALYKDIQAIHEELTAPTNLEDLVELTAEFAPDAYAPDAYAPDAYAPDAYAPDAYAPDAYAPDAYAPDAYAPDAYAPDAYAPDAYAPDAYAPDAYAPDAYAPDAYAPDAYAPDAYAPDLVYASAQVRSLIGISAFDGLADEAITVDTWDNSGDFYVRVRGRNGAFDPTASFLLETKQFVGTCEGVDPTLPPTTLIPSAGSYRTLILTDPGRMDRTDPLLAALQQQVATFAARPEIAGVVVNIGDDTAVAETNGQADDSPTCPAAKNLVATAIKKIIDGYWQLNPSLQYIVVIGNDDVIPFYRHPDRALLANEKNYQPPVLDTTTSYANLALGYVLSQDVYGSSINLSLSNTTLPVPNLAVGRLVETPADILNMLAAYDATVAAGTPGVAPTPQTSLVTGYDFLEDAALAIRDELEAGIGTAADSLITPRDLSPLSNDVRVWTADDLRNSLLVNRHDVLFLAGHFSAYSALAADFSTRVTASEVAQSTVDLQNALVYSAGCHSGYNIVNEHGIPKVTVEPDWAQAFAQKGSTLIAGTGYQYGDTDFLKYSEQIYLNFTQELLVGSGPIAIGDALVAAKQRFLAETTELRGIHEKSMLATTLYGLPMMSVDMPFGRTTPVDPPSIAQTVLPASVNTPGATLGLQTSDVTIPFNLGQNTVTLKSARASDSSTVDATYLLGSDGVVSNPAEPVLPLELRNASIPSTVLRGIGFRGGSYVDLPNVRPLTGAATTEVRGVHPPFLSEVFFPIRPWRANYFDVLADPENGITRLAITPGQFVSDGPASTTGILRRWNSMDFRLYYSANTTTFALGSVPASSAPPAIAKAAATPGADDVSFRISVVGDPAAGIQDVWVTYTTCDGNVCNGAWQTLDLVQNGGDSTLWEGTLPLAGTLAANIRYIVQAVNGVGLVSLATNLGEYFVPGVDPADPTAGDDPLSQPKATTLAFESAPGSGPYSTKVPFSARLTDETGPVGGQTVKFALGSQRKAATTDGDGLASVEIPLLGLPGDSELRVSFVGNTDYQPSDATQAFTIVKQATKITLPPQPAPAQFSDDSLFTATLTDVDGRTLREKTVFFTVVAAGGEYGVADITNFVSQVSLRSVPLPAGMYALNAYFVGTVPLPNTEPLELTDVNYKASSASTTLEILAENAAASYAGDTVIQAGSALNVAAVVVQEEDGSPGDITLAQVRFDLLDANEIVVASAVGTVGSDHVAHAVMNGLAAGTYAVKATVTGGYFASPPSPQVPITVNTENNNGPPVCLNAVPSADSLWPPNHNLGAIDVLGVVDPDGGPLSIAITGIFQDEPVNGADDGDTAPDGQGVGTERAEVRAERAGDGNGRVYHIKFIATDDAGQSCSGEVLVGIPVSKKGTAIDDGALYDSTGGVGGANLRDDVLPKCGQTCIFLPLVSR